METNWKTTIEIDGKKIPLNKFANAIIGSSILGLLAPLKGVENPKNISISLKIEENK